MCYRKGGMIGKADSPDRPTEEMPATGPESVRPEAAEQEPMPRLVPIHARADATDPRRRIHSGPARTFRERDLLVGAAGGDDAAASFLFTEHVDAVFRAVARVLGSGHPDVDDVVQAVFITALDQAERFEGRSRLSTWLVGIAIRKSIDAVRASERRARWRRVRDWVGVFADAPPDPFARLEAKTEAQRQLSKLNLDQRAVFVLVEIEQYTLKEASEMLNTGLSTLHARLQAARKKLHHSPAPSPANDAEDA